MTKITRRFWSATELYLLRELYPDLPTADVAALLDRKISTVHQCAAKHGIKKSAYFLAKQAIEQRERARISIKIRASFFRPGLVPWNAGLKGWTAGGRSAQTRFNAGNLPASTLPIGSYRIAKHHSGWQQVEQKVHDKPGPYSKRWVSVSRLVWEAAHGPVPSGYVVAFKPGFATLIADEVTIDKLECITRTENLQRNSPIRSNPALWKLIQLKGAINRQVNRIQSTA